MPGQRRTCEDLDPIPSKHRRQVVLAEVHKPIKIQAQDGGGGSKLGEERVEQQ